MKTNQTENPLSEAGINGRLQYRLFIAQAQKSPGIKTKKMARTCDKENRGTLALLGLDDVCFQSDVCIYPEFIAYTNHLYGLPRKLLNYIIFFELSAATGIFVFDAATIQRFASYCLVFEEPLEDNAAALQGLKRLKQMNIIVSTGDDSFMLNPLVAGTANGMRRKKLIDTYCNYLAEQGLDTSADFFPKLLGL